MALGRTPGADPCGTQRGKGAAGERLPLSPRGAKRERSAETGTGSWRWAPRVSATARGHRHPVQPEGADSREVPSFAAAEASKPPASAAPQPPAARLAPLRQEAVPAPPRAAPTNWRKKSFSKPELGTSVPLTVLC